MFVILFYKKISGTWNKISFHQWFYISTNIKFQKSKFSSIGNLKYFHINLLTSFKKILRLKKAIG